MERKAVFISSSKSSGPLYASSYSNIGFTGFGGSIFRAAVSWKSLDSSQTLSASARLGFCEAICSFSAPGSIHQQQQQQQLCVSLYTDLKRK